MENDSERSYSYTSLLSLQDKKKEKKSKKKEKEDAPAEEAGDAPKPEAKKATKAPSNVFALFNQAQIQEFKEVCVTRRIKNIDNSAVMLSI